MTTLTLENKSAQYLQSFDQEVIGLLDAICAELEITPAMFQLAKERYASIAAYLNEEGSPLRQFYITIYPHGSTNLETTVKPSNGGEHDVDVIARLLVQETSPQTAFLDLIYNRLKQRGCYTLKRMNRCVRVQYADEFHIDITPAIRSYVLEKLGRVTRHFDHVIDLNVILYLNDRHRGRPGKDFRQVTLGMRLEMLYEHEGHRGLRRKRRKQFTAGLQATSRSANTCYGKTRRCLVHCWFWTTEFA